MLPVLARYGTLEKQSTSVRLSPRRSVQTFHLGVLKSSPSTYLLEIFLGCFPIRDIAVRGPDGIKSSSVAPFTVRCSSQVASSSSSLLSASSSSSSRILFLEFYFNFSLLCLYYPTICYSLSTNKHFHCCRCIIVTYYCCYYRYYYF